MYRMLSPLSIALIVVLVVLILTSMCSSCMAFVPHRADTVFSKEYKFEGFTATKPDTGYSTKDEKNIDSSYSAYLINDTDKDCKKVYGFGGVYCSPSGEPKKLDAFGEVKGDLSCLGENSGLTNSMGGLCLDEEHKQLLSTRGGNQTA